MDIQRLRKAVNERYELLLQDIENKRTELERWRTSKLQWLDVLESNSPDNWLNDTPWTVEGGATPSPPVSASTSQDYAPYTPHTFRQTDVIRTAVAAIRGPVSNEVVRDWLRANRPDVEGKVNPSSIRAALARLCEERKLKVIDRHGNMRIYEKVETPQRNLLAET